MASAGKPYRDHRELVNERRFTVWKVVRESASGQPRMICPGCMMGFRVNLDHMYTSMQGSDLRPCPYCWKLSRLPHT